MIAKLIRDMTCPVDRDNPTGVKPEGTLIDHPDAFRLVLMGVAVAADDECAERANITPEQFARARHAYERVDRGISPDDFEAYDAGYMIGYNPDGTWKPGPNIAELDEETGEDEDLDLE
jgi:hypothetical protein